jgi:DNA-binding response OmpR family regulator
LLTPQYRLLLIDDDAELGELLAACLRPEGFTLTAAGTGLAGVAHAARGDFDVVVLDVMLPDLNGFDVLRRIRKVSPVPVLMLTARGEDVDRIVGLELGADDYLPKPFNPRELAARLRAILRRGGRPAPPPAPDRLVVGDLDVNLAAREVRQNGVPVELTSVELAVLVTLLRSAGQIVERGTLFHVALDRPPVPLDRSIDMHICHLRKKLGHSYNGVERIKAIRGVGYIYTVSASPA